MATDRELYEEMYARQLAEGVTLEQAMRSNRASTPEDYLRAFGNSDDPHQQWRKIEKDNYERTKKSSKNKSQTRGNND